MSKKLEEIRAEIRKRQQDEENQKKETKDICNFCNGKGKVISSHADWWFNTSDTYNECLYCLGTGLKA